MVPRRAGPKVICRLRTGGIFWLAEAMDFEAATRAATAAERLHPAGTVRSVLPEWPPGTVTILATAGEAPHAIPVSAAVRAGPRHALLGLALSLIHI